MSSSTISFTNLAISKALLLLLLFHVPFFTYGLTLPTSLFSKQSTKENPIKNVAIIGSGIAGLSLAHALENSETCAKTYLDALGSCSTSSPPLSSSPLAAGGSYGIQCTIFDSRSSFNFEAGAGVQINGGASTLHKINPILFQSVKEASLPLKKIRSRAKPWFGASSPGDNNNKDYDTLLELDLKNVIQQAGGEVEKELIVDGEVMAYTIMRGALQETLYDELPQDTSARVNFGKTLVGIESNGENDGIMCNFQDGTSSGPFDLVVGCDGINSAVREYVDKVSISQNDKEKRLSSSIYSGIRIQYAVQDGDTLDNDELNSIDTAELVQYFGEGAYALAGIYGNGKNRKPNKGAFLISRDKGYFGPFKLDKNEDDDYDGNTKRGGEKIVQANENADWTQDVRSLGSDMTKRISECEVPNLQIGPIVDDSERFFELGVYFHNPFSFNGWSRQVGSTGRYVVLAGDAGHAMPPFLGQGSNQAIQDSFCLATTIFEHNANCILAATSSNSDKTEFVDDVNESEEPKSFQQLLKQYEKIRWAPTTSITLKAIFLGYLETGERGFLSKFRDAFFFFAGKVGLARKVFLDSATPQVKK